mmetsp:Transcript_114/g.277  ORF Transcript_114/g.277 Transcript_114/m.277 type:complete len:244 (-) Transcript_114:12-743(-)
MRLLQVLLQVARVRKCLAAPGLVANVVLHSGMGLEVVLEVAFLREALSTILAGKGLGPGVDALVRAQRGFRVEALGAVEAAVGLVDVLALGASRGHKLGRSGRRSRKKETRLVIARPVQPLPLGRRLLLNYRALMRRGEDVQVARLLEVARRHPRPHIPQLLEEGQVLEREHERVLPQVKPQEGQSLITLELPSRHLGRIAARVLGGGLVEKVLAPGELVVEGVEVKLVLHAGCEGRVGDRGR